MKRIIFLIPLIFAVALHAVTLSVPSKYTIVVPSKATKQENYSAKLLSEYLQKLYGVAIPVASEDASPRRPWISIGETAFALSTGKNTIPFQGYSLAVSGENLLIRGGFPGPLNGVLTYLDEDLGVRWYAEPYTNIPGHPEPGLTVIPSLKGQPLKVQPRTYTPAFDMRDVMYMYGTTSNPESTLFFRQAPICYHSFAPRESGAVLNSYVFVHTYTRLLNPKKYYDKHPEYYALQNGKRTRQAPDSGSVCYTHPDVPILMAEHIREEMKATPDAIYYAVECNDTGAVQCECPNCKPLIEKYGLAGIQLYLANKVAEILVKDYPNIRISTLVYGTNLLNKSDLKAHPNVFMCLAPIGDRFNEVGMLLPLSKIPPIVKSIDECHVFCKDLYYWDYLESYRMPFPNFDQFRDTVRFLASKGVRKYFADCTNNGATLTPVKKWVYARLLWNPQADMDALINEFVTAYYSKAAPEISAYIALIRKAWQRFMDAYDKAKDGVFLTYTAEERQTMRQLFEAALRKAAGDDVLTGRIAREYIMLLVMELDGNPQVTGVEQYARDVATAKRLLPYAPRNAGYVRDKLLERWEKKLVWDRRTHRDDEYSPNTITVEKSLTVAGMSEYLKDASARDGMAMKHYGKQPWGIQWKYHTFIDYLVPGTTYVMRLRVRPEVKKARTSGPMFSFLAYHDGNEALTRRQPVFKETFTQADAAGTYRWVILGKLLFKNPRSRGMFWMDAHVNADEALWYDCIEFIPIDEFREKDKVPNKTMEL